MGSENSEPNNINIVKIGILSIVTLVAVRFGLVSYFQIQKDAEYTVKIGAVVPADLTKLRGEEKRFLTESKTPITKAMEMVAKGGAAMAMPEMAKAPSADMQPMTGWLQRPRPQPEAPMVVMPAVLPSTDGGVATVGDAGPVAASTDAGAPAADAGAKHDAHSTGGHEKHP